MARQIAVPAGLTFLLLGIWIHSCLGVQTFLRVQSLLGVCEIRRICDFWVPRSLLGDQLQISHCVVRKLYNLFCIFIIIITIISTVISFIALLNCLYINPGASPFLSFSSLSCWGKRGGTSKWLSGVSSWLLGWTVTVVKGKLWILSEPEFHRKRRLTIRAYQNCRCAPFNIKHHLRMQDVCYADLCKLLHFCKSAFQVVLGNIVLWPALSGSLAEVFSVHLACFGSS